MTSTTETSKRESIGVTLRDNSKRKSLNYATSGSAQIKHFSSNIKHRKASFGFCSVPGIRPLERSSAPSEFRRPVALFLPTYQLTSHKRFNRFKVQGYVEALAAELFEGHIYSDVYSPMLALRFATEITGYVKNMNFDRYRLLVTATIGQKRSQSYNNAVAFIWDHEHDDYVDVHTDSTTAFLQITIFAVYLD